MVGHTLATNKLSWLLRECIHHTRCPSQFIFATSVYHKNDGFLGCQLSCHCPPSYTKVRFLRCSPSHSKSSLQPLTFVLKPVCLSMSRNFPHSKFGGHRSQDKTRTSLPSYSTAEFLGILAHFTKRLKHLLEQLNILTEIQKVVIVAG